MHAASIVRRVIGCPSLRRRADTQHSANLRAECAGIAVSLARMRTHEPHAGEDVQEHGQDTQGKKPPGMARRFPMQQGWMAGGVHVFVWGPAV